MEKMLQKVVEAGRELANESVAKRNKFLRVLAKNLKKNANKIINANKKDIAKMCADDLMRDRLMLDEVRIFAMADSLKEIVEMEDPLGRVLDKREVNGLHLKKVSVPFGVVGVIYESRPNVTVDVAALCVKSGNCAVLRGGSEAYQTNKVLVSIIVSALVDAGLPRDCVVLLGTDRAIVKEMLKANKYIDVVIPRGGRGLIDMVRENSRIPVIETGAGVVHTYVDNEVDIKKAASVVFNAKVSRPSVCNALDTLLVHKKVADRFLKELLPKLKEVGVEVCNEYGKEFLSLKMSVKIVRNIDEAIDHISKYSSKHSEAILTSNKSHAREFSERVDAAVVYVNTSTRFTDGGMFGLGAEIGISTQKLHARGPMGIRELTTYKWQVSSDYLIR
ncbi:MAG TPA: glutamate-5-semialdehyde dehydrogenase [Rikenellaceae bacterium]|nr:MAG: glutamate-5-semialdehyde dehydrogenase [Candidatus Peregrinibacteria bacterium RIFOXYA2_FULL_41_18]OGJ48380.1 MAG: glutamate-5-semialdehyde dehydrogenase [Candidatus Peregrinibacteria bacterium RIFOXYB12_FULL_41_12]OGJ53159.1 MAG: glutamate-5-semialdehyde dehydrogenase [Candidatus Peregrinibacteria bacterium RIFOXYB2_FULL_41_88]OGJ53439.1 MAG: glutamate-5-semialdehyde dehydrogenase [Candidatus Peregrinibacteria bacterium RIFOXYC2_FULL_41_22]HBY02206.1 glutamate-5-semialdehyde dehydrogen